MSARALRAGKAFIEMALKDRGVQSGLLKIERKLHATGEAFRSFGGIGVTAGAAVGAALGGAVNQFAKTGDELNKMSARTGFAAQSLSELKFVAQQSGGDFAMLEKGVRTMAKTVLNAERGLSTATDTLSDLGVSVDDLRGKSPEQLFGLFADKIAAVEDPTRQAALAMQVFGTNGQKLLPMLQLGSSGMQELRDEANALGITLGDEDAAAAAELTDALNRTWQQLMALVNAVGSALAGPLTELLSYTTEYLAETIKWVQENQELVVGVAAAAAIVTVLGGATLAVGTAFSLAAAAVGAFSGIIGAVAAVLASPVLLIGGIVVGLAALVDWLFLGGKGTQFLADVAGQAFKSIASAAGSMVTSVLGSLGEFAAGLLGFDVEPSVSADVTGAGPGALAVESEVADVLQEQQAAAKQQADDLNRSLEGVAASADAQEALTRAGLDVAVAAADSEEALLGRIAFATEQARDILRRMQNSDNGGLTFA